MEQETKVLPVALTKEQRTRLGVMAAERCVAMTELVRWWIDEKWGGRTSGPVAKTPAIERKSASVESGYVDLNKVAPVELESSVESRVCAGCNLKVKSWIYDKRGKPICPDCAERLSGSNP